ncbi:hypothetical protein IT417_01145 [bacterium]|nr:hypothetical protein [bacterium]
MSKQKEQIEEQTEKLPYKINDRVKQTGFAANYVKVGGPLIVVSKEKRDADIDPNTGQYSNSVIKFQSKVFINGKERESFDLPGDLDMKVVYSLGQARIIVLSEDQGKTYNEFAKKLHAGLIK